MPGMYSERNQKRIRRTMDFKLAAALVFYRIFDRFILWNPDPGIKIYALHEGSTVMIECGPLMVWSDGSKAN